MDTVDFVQQMVAACLAVITAASLAHPRFTCRRATRIMGPCGGFVEVLDSGEDLEFDDFDPKPKREKLDLVPD